MRTVADRRWEDGQEHQPKSKKLLKLINKLDTLGELDLRTGGDGDIGETLMYYLDELIETKKIDIIFPS